MGDQFGRDERMPTGRLHDVLDENVPCHRVNFGIEHGDELAEVVAGEGAQRDVSDLDATFECGQEPPARPAGRIGVSRTPTAHSGFRLRRCRQAA